MMLIAPTLGARMARAVCWLAVAGGMALAVPAHADEHIWSALVLATQAEEPKPLPTELAKIGPKIVRIFGYNQLEIIGSATKTIDEEVERWLVPTPNFWLCVKSNRKAEGAYTMDLKIFQDKRCLVETQAKLSPTCPLLIRGPVHARGQLIIVLQVQP
jgi:hypothetical protein